MRREAGRSGYPAISSEFGLLLFLGLLWGLPFALTKIALSGIPPVTLAAIRVLLAACVLWPLVLLRSSNTGFRWTLAGQLCVQGLLSCAIPYALIAIGQRSVSSGLASILNSSTPLFTYLFAAFCSERARISADRLFGVLAGFAGVLTIVGLDRIGGISDGIGGHLAILIATASSAAGALYGGRLADLRPDLTAAAALTAAAIALVPLSLILEAPFESRPSAEALIAMGLNGLLPTALGFVVYFRLVDTLGSLGVSAAGYLKPCFGVLIGWAVFGEQIGWAALVGLAVIFLSVALVTRRPRRAVEPLPSKSGLRRSIQ